MTIYDVSGNPLLESVEIEEYYHSEMEDTVSKVRALQTEPNLTFFIITDIHAYYVTGAEELYKKSAVNMQALAKEIPCDGIINLGDSIEGYALKATAQNYGNQISNAFRAVGLPYYAVIGNHDDNRYNHAINDDRLTVPEQYQLFINPTRKVTTDTTGLNYFMDFEEFKIRIITLNSVSDYYYNYNVDTRAWLSEVLASLPTGYKVLVLTHVAPVAQWNYNNKLPSNSGDVITALSGVDTMAIICGHNHVDAVFSTPFNGITLCCEKFENENGDPTLWPAGAVKAQRTLETASEDCWTVCVIRPNSQKINFVRFGAGSDYEIDYGGET